MTNEEALDEVGQFSRTLVMKPGMTEEDTIRVAAALVAAGETIYRMLGGAKFAAAQFYIVADRCAADPGN